MALINSTPEINTGGSTLETTSEKVTLLQKDLSLELGVAMKMYPTEGNLVYEYNPLRNYRLDLDMFFYLNKFYTKEELASLFITISKDEKEESINKFYADILENGWYSVIPKTESQPILYQKGLLVDFTTEELQFDLNHPVSIIPEYSYDNSVDLIINDGKNQPRLINTRFSATERNQYEIIDRNGNNDTNIYDRGAEFDVDTSLYKKITTIPVLKFTGTQYGGVLPIGTYTFYFKYIDDDGNESDFFAESGQVLVFIGNSPGAILSGFREENSYKTANFELSNLDKAYQKIVVYFTRSSSDVLLNMTTQAYRISNYYTIGKGTVTKLSINGYEEKTLISIDLINDKQLIYLAVETQDTCQNMLFFAHNYREKSHHDDLRDIALRFIPKAVTEEYTPLESDYSGNFTNTYYNSLFTYNKTGYWSDIYRFGMVFIYSDNTLSDVYNVRGCSLLSTSTEYGNFSKVTFIDDDKNRQYINYDDSTYEVIGDGSPGTVSNENCKGVIQFANVGLLDIIGITFTTEKEVIDYLRDTLKIKGFFFVRQKRIPTILCLAYMIGVDKLSNLPALPIDSTSAQIETVLDPNRLITHSFSDRKIQLANEQIRKQAAICPEYDVNSPYLNNLFTGSEFVIEPYLNEFFDSSFNRDYSPTFNNSSLESTTSTVKIIGVEDNTKLVAIGDKKFSARAGEAEEAFRYEYIGQESKYEEAWNITRGSYGPYLGITGFEEMGKLVNIRIPDYTIADMDKYFTIRYNDPFPYYAISDRFDLQDDYTFTFNESTWTSEELHRGDCFICNVTHRLNRNFLDPSAPTNDAIVDPKCWQENIEVEDGIVKKSSFEKINLGDLNAVKMGRFVNLVIRANMNLNIRALDTSYTDENALTGHPRSFVPYVYQPLEGPFKVPEALCYNKGFEKSVSEKIYFGLNDDPVYKEDFTNRISYSNIKVLNSFLNGFRVFKGLNYRDYPKTYGSIIKIIESSGSLICVLEHGIYKIPVNERAVAAQGEGGMAYINTSNVLPDNPDVLSYTYGSQWRDSVIKTPTGIYGVDTVGKKIWKVSEKGFQIISDFKVGKFLIDNITLTERELTPIMGVRNVKTHYNKYKGDVMFTFYDNLYGFEEKVWNLCYNENIDKWVTFYSWVPSYSENIYNSYFSFDRNTSKWIAKLGISKHGNSFSDGVTLSDNIISDDSWSAELYLDNRTLPSGDKIENIITYELLRDNFGNNKKFEIKDNKISLKNTTVEDLYSLLYWRKCTKVNIYDKDGNGSGGSCVVINPVKTTITDSITNKEIVCVPCILLGANKNYLTNETNPTFDGKYVSYADYINGTIYKSSKGKRIWSDTQINGDSPVYLLNIRAHITTTYSGTSELGEALVTGMANRTSVDSGYYDSVVAVMPKYNMQYLSTDFWKHGKAGIIDIADKIYPTYWYGKLHPFEFEFIVSKDVGSHKIFDNLQIISNNAEPESFHYEIVGDSYEFAKDKENMYIRQEATKHLWQYNGENILYDDDYSDGVLEHRKIEGTSYYDKSTLFPLYFSRLDTINEIEDYYNGMDGSASGKDYRNMAGGEIKYYPDLLEYHIVNHAKAVDMREGKRLRGNMNYIEDKWYVLINPLNIIQCNEPDWNLSLKEGTGDSELVPVEINNTPIPDSIKQANTVEIPDDWNNRGIVSWSKYKTKLSAVKLKDKFIKIRIRYSGKKPAIILSLNTLYSISYS